MGGNGNDVDPEKTCSEAEWLKSGMFPFRGGSVGECFGRRTESGFDRWLGRSGLGIRVWKIFRGEETIGRRILESGFGHAL